MLEDPYDKPSLRKTQVFEWHKPDRASVNDDPQWLP
jgi:hypothetical protein